MISNEHRDELSDLLDYVRLHSHDKMKDMLTLIQIINKIIDEAIAVDRKVQANRDFLLSTEDKFLGEDINFWIEAKKQIDKLNLADIITENATLRARLSFIEHHINLITIFRDEVKI